MTELSPEEQRRIAETAVRYAYQFTTTTEEYENAKNFLHIALREQALSHARKKEELASEVARLNQELNWQNNRNSGQPTRGGFEFYINEEWTGLASAALDSDPGWHAALYKKRMDPDDERVRVRRVVEDDQILKDISSLESALKVAKAERDDREARLGAIEREHSCEGDGCPVCYSLSRLPDEPISRLTGVPKEG